MESTGIWIIQTESIEINDFDIQVTNIIAENELYFILRDLSQQSNKDESLELFCSKSIQFRSLSRTI